jgi:hypothetical protein
MPDGPVGSRPLIRLRGWSRRTFIALAVAVIGWPVPAAAQQSAHQADSAYTQIRTTLRSFYFNLAHRDWEALAADILSAKVIASHPPPVSLLLPKDLATRADRPEDCPCEAAARVERANITLDPLDGDWARAAVPACPPTGAADEFRLVRFERRWRIIYIYLRQQRSGVPLAR